mmetsp:Transcript_40205/g.72197  ORF Transcript_40205/g.72197 Transcript_40205/m.72197 type:complete len:371 (-) Transcript_40205:1037-2149(-)|eukprot:CAMPEP_0177763152 /NCGR_PEP_ID=MMETSP0491_2-20121128/6721_1 /TAXON_ID=63592 /ORGANISM="Tetraselmis chuii, Strain PLY429" /LENGTH=370 /DNA_ID=CAMNT_0019279245 /DNA_START=79 /DNA_END=1191 /DNA_ORIENTATION=+
MVLVQVVHSIQAVTATVPFGMIMLLDHIKRKTIPPELRIRMIFPTNGILSCSYWDVPEPDALKVWLDEFIGDDCVNTISEVQEDFAWGISAPLSTARGAEGVSHLTAVAANRVGQKAQEYRGAASKKFGEFDEKYKLSDHATKTITVTKERASEAGKVIGTYTDKAMQNERVAKTVAGVGSVAGATWKTMGKGFGFLSKKFGEISDTVSSSVQEYNNADNLHGSSSYGAPVEVEGGSSDLQPAVEPPAATTLSPSFAGFDDDPAEFDPSAGDIGSAAHEAVAAPVPAEAPAPTVADSFAENPPAPAYTIDDDSFEGGEDKDGNLDFEADAEELPTATTASTKMADAEPAAAPAEGGLISLDEPEADAKET